MTSLTVPDDPKMLRETLCVAEGAVARQTSGTDRREEHLARIARLITECERHRPIGVNGKHGDRHTLTCGCDDVPRPGGEPTMAEERAAAALYYQVTSIAAAGGASVELLARQLARLTLAAGLDVAEIAANDREHPSWLWGTHDHEICCTGCLELLNVDPAAEDHDPLDPDNVMARHRATALRAKMLGAPV